MSEFDRSGGIAGKKRQALGKGLSSLLGMEPEDSSGAFSKFVDKPIKQGLTELKLEQIEPNPSQPRKFFDDKMLQELASSIEVEGVIQPIIVAKTEEPGKYTIIAGERRWRASKLANKATIPVIIKEGSDEQLMRLALIENIQRADLNIIEEAEAYQSLINDFGLTQENCAQKVGKDRTTVTNALRLLILPAQVRDDLIEGTLTNGHARALLALESPKKILEARHLIVKKKLNVRQTEALVKALKTSTANDTIASTSKRIDADLNYVADNLRNKLKTKVRIAGSGQRGKIEISYFSAAELDRVVQLIGKS